MTVPCKGAVDYKTSTQKMKKPGKIKIDPATILIVDDDKSVLFASRAIIEEEGHDVITAPDGIAALTATKRDAPDIIILDMDMPEINGCEVCQQLKGEPATANIPIIFLSSHNMAEEKVKAFEAGGVDYLVKPYSKQELIVRLRTHLTLQRTQNILTAEIKKNTLELREKNCELQETNLVLKRLIHEIKEEKLEINRIIQTNIKRLILPDLAQMAEASALQQRYQLRDAIQTNLIALSGPITGEHIDAYSLLTPTELRVLNFIGQGRSSKEIAGVLNVSPQTVATHRKKIRKKLNITGKKINLTSFITRSE
ncbi:Regulatory protein, luxR family [Candidatus Electrothrix laxa]